MHWFQQYWIVLKRGQRYCCLMVGKAELPVDVLPAGCRPGMWLLVQLEDGKVVGAELDPHKTAETGARIRSKMDELRRRGRVLP